MVWRCHSSVVTDTHVLTCYRPSKPQCGDSQWDKGKKAEATVKTQVLAFFLMFQCSIYVTTHLVQHWCPTGGAEGMKSYSQASLASEIIVTSTRSWSFTCPFQLSFTLVKYTEVFHSCIFRHPRASGQTLISASLQNVLKSWHSFSPSFGVLQCQSKQSSVDTDTNRLTGGTKQWGTSVHN